MDTIKHLENMLFEFWYTGIQRLGKVRIHHSHCFQFYVFEFGIADIGTGNNTASDNCIFQVGITQISAVKINRASEDILQECMTKIGVLQISLIKHGKPFYVITPKICVTEIGLNHVRVVKVTVP